MIPALGQGRFLYAATKRQLVVRQIALLAAFLPAFQKGSALRHARFSSSPTSPVRYQMLLLQSAFLPGDIWPPLLPNTLVLLTPEAFDAVLLIGGDFARQGQPRVEAQMGDRGKCFLPRVRAEVELADNAALITHVGDPRHRTLCWNRAAGLLAKRRLEFGLMRAGSATPRSALLQGDRLFRGCRSRALSYRRDSTGDSQIG